MRSILNALFVLIALSICLTNCRAQSGKDEVCNKAYIAAKKSLNDFYRTNDTLCISKALASLDSSLSCQSSRSKAIYLKKLLFSLGRKYSDGAAFIKTLDSSDFNKSYEKQMSYNYFTAMAFDLKNDTLSRNNFYRIIIDDSNNYIKGQPDFDKTAYRDLFFIRGQFESVGHINTDIESLKHLYPSEISFLDSLKVFQEERSKSVNIVQ
jgi:hypothetical protein